jgi:hypothetical protein
MVSAEVVRPSASPFLPRKRFGQTISTYSLYGLDAIPADVIVQGDGVRAVERGTRRTLADVKQEPGRRTLASVQSGGPNLVRRESAPETMTTRWVYLSCPLSLI